MLGSSYHNLSMQTTGLAGIEPTAYRLGGDRSIQLSYSPKQHLIVSDFVTIAGLIVIRLFARLKPKELQKCFIGWMQAVQTMTEGELLNIDGKTLRGAKEAGLGATHAEETSARFHPQSWGSKIDRSPPELGDLARQDRGRSSLENRLTEPYYPHSYTPYILPY